MGSWLSKNVATDPATYATKVDSSKSALDDAPRWRSYDFVIIGGGTAGCVLASRLSEDPNVTVLLIEAGKSDPGNIMARMPLTFAKVFRTAIDWDYTTIPQAHVGGNEIYWARGKVLGGTSAINACIYHRPSAEDFDSWAQSGATGWAFKDLEPYFRKAEGYTPDPRRPEVSLGDKGPWRVGFSQYTAPAIEATIEACKAVNIPYVNDLNAKDSAVGVGYFTGIIDSNGRRQSAATAYLTPDVLARPNLTVAVGATVEKLLTAEAEGVTRAIGVQLTHSSTSPSYRVAAKKEVILSAGVVGSPQILLMSGIGSEDELEAVGVETVKQLGSVGKHLVDHISSGPMILRAKPGVTIDHLNSPLSGASALLKFLISGTGPFASLAVGSAAFVRSDDSSLFATATNDAKDLSSGPNSPDIELMFTPAIVLDYFTPSPPGANGVTFASIALKPDSEGSIKLKSNSIWDKPIIDGNYLESESDVNVILRGIRLILRMARTEPLRSVLELKSDSTDTSNLFWPGDADPDKLTDDELKAWIRRNARPACHPVGTCRMGTSPESSVVDHELRVHGIPNLRVVDASVFPTQVSGHPCSVIVAMAEKISDMIKGTA